MKGILYRSSNRTIVKVVEEHMLRHKESRVGDIERS